MAGKQWKQCTLVSLSPCVPLAVKQRLDADNLVCNHVLRRQFLLIVNSVVRRDQIEEATAETKHLAMLSTQPYDEQNDILTASILTTRICSVGMVTNTENKPAQPFLHLWIRVRQLLSSSIQTLSMQLRRVDVMTDDELAGVLKRIRRMIVVEV